MKYDMPIFKFRTIVQAFLRTRITTLKHKRALRTPFVYVKL